MGLPNIASGWVPEVTGAGRHDVFADLKRSGDRKRRVAVPQADGDQDQRDCRGQAAT